MITLEKFKAKHFEDLKDEKSVMGLIPFLSEEHLNNLENSQYAYAGIKNGRTLFCAGVAEYWTGRAESWAILRSSAGNEMLGITKIVKRFLEVCPIRRIEASIDVDFEQGHRWAKMLGFNLEAACLKSYFPDGKDCALYARVR